MQVLKSMYGNFRIIPNDGGCYEDELDDLLEDSFES